MTSQPDTDEHPVSLPQRNAHRIRDERQREIAQLKEDLAALQEENEQLQPDMVETKTPIGDLSWYIKWVAAITGIIGAFCSAGDMFPWNIGFGLVSLVLWTYVGMLWNDRAIMIMNSVIAGAFALSLMISQGWTQFQPLTKPEAPSEDVTSTDRG